MNWLTRLFRRSAALPEPHEPLPAAGVVVTPEETAALDAQWRKRSAELGDWQPTNGWLVRAR